jgi:hypothetical protein
MKKLVAIVLVLTAIGSGSMAQTGGSLDGVWLGTLEVQGAKLRLSFTFSVDENGALSSVMTSIDQGNAVVPIQQTTLKGDTLAVSHPPIMMEMKGLVDTKKGTWDCQFQQAGVKAPILFIRKE